MSVGRARAATLAAALLLLPACLAVPPRIEVAAHTGRVRAETHHEARLVAEVLDELAPQVASLLPDTLAEPVEIWVQRELAVYRGWPVQREVPAFTIEGEGRIHMLGGDRAEVSAALSHELVHALLGPSWATLPPVAEEGLADWVQERLNPRYAASMRADHLVKASAAVGGLPIGVWRAFAGPDAELIGEFCFPRDEEPLDPRAALEGSVGRGGSSWRPYAVSVSDPRLYGVGYLVVARIAERIGIRGLHRLCVQAGERGLEHVPTDWLLEAADLGRDAGRWRAIIIERFGGNELLALSRSLVPDLVAVLVEHAEERHEGGSLRRFLQRERLGVGLVGGQMRLSVTAIPEMFSELRRAWPDGQRTALRSPGASGAVSSQGPRGAGSALLLAASR